ncbi:uncharacterized protein [Rutidosis leptorrhynchoides]|uniref:uncharacterized protein n=1 Tax=Rutidosis leptorrhynchoides TaxID=125765 RepID=UPI003A996F64
MGSDFNRSLSSTTWYNIVNACHAMQEFQISFKHSFIKSIGSGDSTAFWLEHWIGPDKLCNLFPRIFRLETVKEVNIKDRLKASKSGLVFEWSWSREPNGRTNKELQAMIKLLSGFSFANCSTDTWSWCLASNELDKRGVDLHSLRCPLCDDGLESVEHSLLLCDRVRDLWARVFKWWGIRNSNPTNLSDLLEGQNASSMSEKGKGLWQAIVWIGLYHIWGLRNKTVFQNKTWNTPMALSSGWYLHFKLAKRELKDVDFSTIVKSGNTLFI